MKTLCPYCDSEDVEKIEKNETYPVPFSKNIIISRHVFRCNTCEAEGNFLGSNDRDLAKKISEASCSSAPALIESLAKEGITMTYFEKALRIPFRTTARWKKKKISHSSLALLRLIRFSPALLEVADDNFSESSQAEYRFKQLFHFFDKYTINPSGSYIATGDKKELKLEGSFMPFLMQTVSSDAKSIWSEQKI